MDRWKDAAWVLCLPIWVVVYTAAVFAFLLAATVCGIIGLVNEDWRD